jgi:hypothetical protein
MVQFKIKANVDIAKLKQVLEKKQKLIQSNVVAILKKDAVPFLIERIMVGFDGLADRAEMQPEDPTNPANWRAEFLAKLEEDLERTFVVAGNKITVQLGDRAFLGYDPSGNIDPNDTEPLHWMVFFIEGLVGDWAFISPDTYQRLNPGGRYQPGWGRFERGFMVSRQEYEEQGWNRQIPFSQLRHPFSGFNPVDIFAEALREFRLRPFIQKAIDAALQGKRL